MNYFWIFGAAILLMFVFSRVRAHRGRPQKIMASAGPRVQGFQLAAFVHPRMSAQCLFDDRVQFGEGFQRKEPPSLPHDEECRCQTIPFSFGASEVFKGALRENLDNRSTIPGMSPQEISRFIDRLKVVEGEGLPENGGDYLDQVDLSLFPRTNRHDIEVFLKERHQFFATPEEASKKPVESLGEDQPAGADQSGQVAK